ncbi:hypothetical protein DEU56DRAFT_890018 [Suillus clintonianus]|uniref:uncharacterized protein n=1 Tax=Suillus clintonianus TaxID=1904413 RepID=UPI001B885202|nr:uncharacterized protein DEU56DRAFT_890018 [Suillus clintonianus]KAG2130702.1 hypothetical protein DEU56DRAFT_890018 [Suillus clintonianus]
MFRVFRLIGYICAPNQFRGRYSLLAMWLNKPILDMFAEIPADTTIPNEYYGVYNWVLRGAFGHVYTVHPFYELPECYKDPSLLPEGKTAYDFSVTYAITLQNNPLLFLEIKPPGHLNDLSARFAADKQMRERFHSLRPITTTPRLHGISVMGQRLAFYHMDKSSGCIFPKLPTSGDVPIDWWKMDITTKAGNREFNTVARDVKNMTEETATALRRRHDPDYDDGLFVTLRKFLWLLYSNSGRL